MTSTNSQLEIIRRNNRTRIMLTVAQHGPITRAHIAQVTGLSMTCVGKIVADLIEEQELTEKGIIATARGRPGIQIDINPMGDPTAGVWIGPESIEIAVANPKCDLLARRTVLYDPAKSDITSIIDDIAHSIQKCTESTGWSPRSLRGIGVTVAGYADPFLGVIESLTNRKGWENVPIVDLIEERLFTPTFVDVDAKAGALYSHWFNGKAQDGGTMYVIAVEGIGSAMILDHEIIRGVHDQAGMFGHITLEPDGPICGCGNQGCLETLASDFAFIRYLWPEKAKLFDQITASDRIALVKQGIDLAKSGDPQAVTAFKKVTKYLGIGIASAIRFFDPRTVWVCGTMVDIEPNLYLDSIRRETISRVSPRARGVEIRPLTGYEDFLLKGAVALVLWQPYREVHQDNVRISQMAKKPTKLRSQLTHR